MVNLHHNARAFFGLEMIILKFIFDLPLNIVFGRGTLNEIGAHVGKYGTKALIVTGKLSTKLTGLLDRCLSLLSASGIEVVVFDRVEQNPLITTVYKGAQMLLERRCDVVIGLGGGSALDCAKGIAFVAGNSGDMEDFIFGRKPGLSAYPVIAVPTTAGTGSEANCLTALTNPVSKVKKSLKAKLIFPKVSIVDPELMTSLPKQSIAASGFDALSHNLEAFLSKSAQPVSDTLAIEAIKLLGEFLPKVYQDPADLEAWERVALASTYGGMNICASGVCAPHALEHPVSGRYNVVHGKGLAAILPKVLEKSYGYADEKYLRISEALGGTGAAQCVDRIKKIAEEMELSGTLSDLGVKREDIDWLSKNSFKTMQANIENNPRIFTLDEVQQLYSEML